MAAIDWKKFHRFQEKPGWCGPASIQMILLAAGIKKSQAEIAADVQKDWWGTTQDITIAYLSRFFGELGFERGATLPDVKQHLEKGRAVIADWWEDLDEREADGHFSLVAEIDLERGRVTLADPAETRKGIWEMAAEDFEKRWYDYLDVNRRIKVERWILWVDLQSKL